MYKNFYTLVRKRRTTEKQKWAKIMNRKYTEEEVKKAKKHVERCSVLQLVREMQSRLSQYYD